MNSLKDIIIYFCQNYPHQKELAKARLTKMVYLADWEAAQESGKQISKIKWIYNHFGPYVEDVFDLAKDDDVFNITYQENIYGNAKNLISVSEKSKPSLSKEKKEILDGVIENTQKLYWDDFIKYVYDTYPIKNSEQFDELDLSKIAHKKRNVIERMFG